MSVPADRDSILRSPAEPAATPSDPGARRVRVHVFVDGRVQGVWFRESARRQADRLRVDGWVRNLPDGRVEAIFEGPGEAVDELLQWARLGPERAQVTALEVYNEEPKGERGFSVR